MAAQLKTDRHAHEHTESSPVTIEAKTVTVDLKRAAQDLDYAKSAVEGYKGFAVYDSRFADIVKDAKLTRIQSREYQFAHEAGVYIKRTDKIYFTANFQTCDPIHIYSVEHSAPHTVSKVEHADVVQPNGACNYKDKILYCSQGSHTTPSALVLVDPTPSSPSSEILATNFQGRPFNSINDVVIHQSNDELWFTDPTYGYEQAFRPSPDLPSQIYRFSPSTGQMWMVADGFSQCNGLCFSPDYTHLYVTDTGACQAHDGGPKDGHNFSMNPRLPATIYEYDVVDNGTRLANRRVFAYCDTGVPDGIKCDTQGNVYSGCGDGVHVWDARGTLLGKIVTGAVCANFCFSRGKGGEEGIWMFCEEELYFCQLRDGVRGALVDIECL
ncbi:hypothetical protein AAFC00_002549 [Neodothiora populina]|uniref:SMP-30/Gluconolactonase/LRE-like region domain-containing protein n=1 Tax=Neodothiora populina TaxID=2781224 RepID=A0ABR3P7F8_9PEZI